MARSLYTNLRQRYGTPSAPDVIARKTSEIIKRVSRSEFNFRAPHQDKSVIVVGGGLAGLRAAECLSIAGFDVALLEAKERVGGRVWTQEISGHLIEVGAELIGQIHPRVLKMAMDFKLGLSLIATEDHYAVMDPAGYSSKNGHELYKQLDAVLMKLSTYAHEVFGRSSPHKPWTLQVAKQLDERSLASWLDEHAPKGDLRDALEYQFSNDNCTATKNQSLLAVLAQVRAGEQNFRKGDFWKKVEVFRCRRGNQAIADKLYERLSRIGIALHPKTPARQIHVTDSGVDVRADNGFSKRADYLVLAVPPWVWPTILPEQPLLSVAGGPAVKHLTVVQDQFWLPDAPTSHGADGLTWEGTNNQVTSSDLVFSIFAGGDAAQRALDAPDVNAHYEYVIRQRFPHYEGAIGRPRFVPWPRDPWLKSGYSCPSPGDVCKNGPVLNDLWKERVAFAGEHVSMGYWGYMEGALWSGEHAAQRIAERVALLGDHARGAT